MRYRFLGDIATADIAFEACGKTMEKLFANAAEALTAVMVDIKDVKPIKNYELRIKNKRTEELLFDFLNELVFLKDAKQLLFSKFKLKIKKLDARRYFRAGKKTSSAYSLDANLWGEKIDPERHQLRSDIKAVTWHMFQLTKEKNTYQARVILDI